MYNGYIQAILYIALILILAKPVGLYLRSVYDTGSTPLKRIFGWTEQKIYRFLGSNNMEEMDWKQYSIAMLMFSLVSVLISYILLRFQAYLPLNPQHFGGKQMTPDLSFNTATSFATNTNWQSYTPEQTVSYFSNMVTLAYHNWASASVGISIALVVIRAFARKETNQLGNFYKDCTRTSLYVLLPISIIGALIFCWQGVPMSFHAYPMVHTLEGSLQTLAIGPVASQEIIKQVGTNGGGFFNANSAHPFENPTSFSNFFTLLLIFLLPAGLVYYFGKSVGQVKQGWSILGAMTFLFLAGSFACFHFESVKTPQYTKLGVNQTLSPRNIGGNMEGKETRFGIGSSTLFATVTTDASCGAVNSMHDSYTPLGGLVPLFNILTGEVIFGGVGAGLYGMIIYAILAVFIAGLMVGRTPEYLGKKIGKFEVQMAMLALLILAADILGFTAIALNTHITNDPKSSTPYASITIDSKKSTPAPNGAHSGWNKLPGSAYGGTDTYYGATDNNTNNSGAHGFSEIFYAFSSTTGNNGSAFAGLTANTPFYNSLLGMSLLIGRFLMIIPLMAMAGSIAKKKIVPLSSGTFATDNATFSVLLVGTIIIVGALTFFPALALGPIVEHLQMMAHKLY